jgi:hypothetical protein
MNRKQDDFSHLRLTILQHQWKEAYTLIAALLANDVPQFTLFVADQIVRTSLRFQPRYDVGWMVRFTEEIIHFIHAGQREGEAPQLPPETGEIFADAPYGVTSLVTAIEDLWDSYSLAHTSDKRAKHLGSAISRIITAEICNYWEIRFPEEVQLREAFSNFERTSKGRILVPPYIDKKKLYQAIGFLKQPESEGYHSARLLNVVDDIERILGEK